MRWLVRLILPFMMAVPVAVESAPDVTETGTAIMNGGIKAGARGLNSPPQPVSTR